MITFHERQNTSHKLLRVMPTHASNPLSFNCASVLSMPEIRITPWARAFPAQREASSS